MSITELIKHVGEEHIQCQYLDSSFDSAKVVKGVGLITFVTEQSKVMERLGVGQRHRCMILWMPDERFPTPAEIRRADAAKARAAKADAAVAEESSASQSEPTPLSDEDAFLDWATSKPGSDFSQRGTWEAALEWERRRVAQ